MVLLKREFLCGYLGHDELAQCSRENVKANALEDGPEFSRGQYDFLRTLRSMVLPREDGNQVSKLLPFLLQDLFDFLSCVLLGLLF